MKNSLFLAAAAATSLFATTALADDHLVLSAGAFNIDEDQTANFGLEYRANPIWMDLKPMIGGQINTDMGMYGYAGLLYDWKPVDNLYIAPSAAVGAYKDGSSVDLGGALEFRTGIEAGYTFDNNYRMGVAFHHISNASIYDRNPGVEQLMVTYSIPLDAMRGY